MNRAMRREKKFWIFSDNLFPSESSLHYCNKKYLGKRWRGLFGLMVSELLVHDWWETQLGRWRRKKGRKEQTRNEI